MKVEQRIGRVDRFGQQSDFVTVRNFIYENTIVGRFGTGSIHVSTMRAALGGFEDILGKKSRIRNALNDELTPEEQNRRIEQTSIAIENRAKPFKFRRGCWSNCAR